jgi:hypothetical protein
MKKRSEHGPASNINFYSKVEEEKKWKQWIGLSAATPAAEHKLLTSK